MSEHLAELNKTDLEVYSTDEKQIGVWIDGKTIYRKVIDTGALPNNTTKNVAHNISNLDRVVNMYGMAKNTTGNHSPISIQYGAQANRIATFISGANISITTTFDARAYTTSYVVLEYTKS